MRKRDWSLVWLLVGVIFSWLYSGKADAIECRFLSELNPYQKEVANLAYETGLPYDLGLTSVAIAWQESKLGLYKVRHNVHNIKDQSYGVMHTVAYWKVKELSSFKAGQWVQEMITNDTKSIQTGVQDILYWQGVAKGDWKEGVGMYNGGFRGNFNYSTKIVNIVIRLKGCW